MTKRKGEIEKELSSLCRLSLQIAIIAGLGQAKAKTRNSFWVSLGGKGPGTWAVIHCIPGALTEAWTWGSNQHPDTGRRHPKWPFNLLATAPTQVTRLSALEALALIMLCVGLGFACLSSLLPPLTGA